MSAKRVRRTAIAGGGMAVVLAGVALASSPLPEKGKVYSSQSGGPGSAFVQLVTASNNARVLLGGPDIYHSGAEGSSVAVPCSTPKGQAQAGFAKTTLKLSKGKYSFSKSWKSKAQVITVTPNGEKLVPLTIHITVAGTVKSKRQITGTVKVKGGGCATHRPLAYKVLLSPTPPLK